MTAVSKSKTQPFGPRTICSSSTRVWSVSGILSAGIGFSANPASIRAFARKFASPNLFLPIESEIPGFTVPRIIPGRVSIINPAVFKALLNRSANTAVSGSPLIKNTTTFVPRSVLKSLTNVAVWSPFIRRGANLSSILNRARRSSSAFLLASAARSFALAISSRNDSASRRATSASFVAWAACLMASPASLRAFPASLFASAACLFSCASIS